MALAAMRVGHAWVEVAAEAQLQEAQWQHRLGHEGDPSGCILLRLRSAAEANAVKAAIADSVVSFGGSPTLLEVEVVGRKLNGHAPGGGQASQGASPCA